MDDPVIRKHNGWEIRNADGLYWTDRGGGGSGEWAPVGMRWSGFSRREMQKKAHEVGGVLVQMTLVRRSRTGRSAVRCPDCHKRERAEMSRTTAR